MIWFSLNTLRPRQNGHHFADDISKCIFLNENVRIPTKISMMFVPKGPINNIPALVQIMAWCRPGNKPLSEPMMVSLTMHICVTPPQWVNMIWTHCGAKVVFTERSTLHHYHHYSSLLKSHDDVIIWKHFLRHWPFVRGIHRSPVNSPHKGQWHRALIWFFDLRLN